MHAYHTCDSLSLLSWLLLNISEAFSPSSKPPTGPALLKMRTYLALSSGVIVIFAESVSILRGAGELAGAARDGAGDAGAAVLPLCDGADGCFARPGIVKPRKNATGPATSVAPQSAAAHECTNCGRPYPESEDQHEAWSQPAHVL